MPETNFNFIISLTIFLLLSACGQKGPLKLPLPETGKTTQHTSGSIHTEKVPQRTNTESAQQTTRRFI